MDELLPLLVHSDPNGLLASFISSKRKRVCFKLNTHTHIALLIVSYFVNEICSLYRPSLGYLVLLDLNLLCKYMVSDLLT